MAKACKNEEHELDTSRPRPTFSNAYDHYFDYYSEEEESTFIVIKDKWRGIKQNNSSGKYLSETELSYLSLCHGVLKNSESEKAYFSKKYLYKRLGIRERQLRTVRKNTSHIFPSKWKKATKTLTGIKKNVYIIRASEKAAFILKEAKYYKSIKLGSQLPTSIYKDENNIIKDRSSESNFLQNSQSEKIEENPTSELPKFLKMSLKNKKCLPNKRKKSTNQERKARICSPKFKQYAKPKSLREHYPLTTEECLELQNRSSREFTLNAMNEILLDMSRKPKESRHEFPSKAAFMAYMSKVYRYEGRDAVKTANTGFKIIARATQAEVITHTTQTQRDDFMATFEEVAINCPTPENRFKAKIACTLPPMISYSLLSNIKSVLFSRDTLEIHLANQLNIDHNKQAILKEAKAVDCKIARLSVCC